MRRLKPLHGLPGGVPEQFVFRCKACGRVAPEASWTLIGRPAWSDALQVRRYPIVECPACQSRSIDLNHGLQVEARPTMRAHEPPPPHHHDN